MKGRLQSSFNFWVETLDAPDFVLDMIARKKDLISMYRRALVNGFMNILVYFNKLANNF